MRLPLAFAVLLLASSQALGEEMGASDDLSYWSDWSDGDQAKDMARSLTKVKLEFTIFLPDPLRGKWAPSAFKHFYVLDSIAHSPRPLVPWITGQCPLSSSTAGFGEAFTKALTVSTTAGHNCDTE
ncbi:hypothetical protein HGM15179_010788 [Zosterops borbonicus]|uniref:Uncharacterized protein n=1 Tax=Zosterops borbonicus TaxID=364589 RepID=A0A8K1LJE0_9PASS|nr:hypothetical protein HGM15179_010788 [Zosterops borbonicus]